MPILRSACLLLLGLMGLVVGPASAQNYPNRSIRLITSPAGGSGDFVARLIAQSISGPLGQSVIVDNRPTVTIGEAVAQAPADGYTIILIGNSFWISPLIQKTPFDPINDFAPITVANTAPNILVIHPSLPVKSVSDLIALAKAQPGRLNYATTGVGSSNHLAAELFKALAGITMERINFKGVGPAVNALLANEVPVLFGTAEVVPHIQSGRLRALGVTSAKPSALFPGIPAVSASLPGYESMQIQAMFTPAKTPQPVINRLNQEIVRALNSADLKEKFVSAGIEPGGNKPEELAAMMKSEMVRMGKVIKDAGIHAD